MPIAQSSLRPTGWQDFGPSVAGRYTSPYGGGQAASKTAFLAKGRAFNAGQTAAAQGGPKTFATMPSYAELLNMGMAPGTAFIVNGQNFLWNGTAVQPADADGKPVATLSEKTQAAFDEAKAVNEQRYGEQKEEFDRLEQEATGLLEGLGKQERADTAQRYRGAAGANLQWAIDRGLSGTSAFPTMQASIAEQEDAELRRLNESLRRERYGAMTGIRGEKLAMMERRTDSYPDIGLMASLEQAQGQWGGGAAGMAQPRMNYGSTGTGTNNGLPVGDPGWNFGAVGRSQYGGSGGGGGTGTPANDPWIGDLNLASGPDLYTGAAPAAQPAQNMAYSGAPSLYGGNSTGFSDAQSEQRYGRTSLAGVPGAISATLGGGVLGGVAQALGRQFLLPR